MRQHDKDRAWYLENRKAFLEKQRNQRRALKGATGALLSVE